MCGDPMCGDLMCGDPEVASDAETRRSRCYGAEDD
jgi:hypothetical protein